MFEDFIDANEFCLHNNVEVSFVESLHDFGLIEITTIEQKRFIRTSNLQQLERLARLHYELDINLEGLDVILALLHRIEIMQQEIADLKHQLKIYRR